MLHVGLDGGEGGGSCVGEHDGGEGLEGTVEGRSRVLNLEQRETF